MSHVRAERRPPDAESLTEGTMHLLSPDVPASKLHEATVANMLRELVICTSCLYMPGTS